MGWENWDGGGSKRTMVKSQHKKAEPAARINTRETPAELRFKRESAYVPSISADMNLLT